MRRMSKGVRERELRPVRHSPDCHAIDPERLPHGLEILRVVGGAVEVAPCAHPAVIWWMSAAGPKPGNCDLIRATSPAVTGQAIEVPLM